MHRLILAFRAFFRILANASAADEIEHMLHGKSSPVVNERPGEQSVPQPARQVPVRNEALNLLAALQREARLIDFIKEPIAGYSDAQVGTAVRDIHRDCGALIERIFGIMPVESAAEGAPIQVSEGFDPSRIRIVGNVTGHPPFRGRLCHHGWEATRCNLPEWTGSERSLYVVAPAEVELK
jgi:hypothetical protein